MLGNLEWKGSTYDSCTPVDVSRTSFSSCLWTYLAFVGAALASLLTFLLPGGVGPTVALRSVEGLVEGRWKVSSCD
jgi:hypothetical protein